MFVLRGVAVTPAGVLCSQDNHGSTGMYVCQKVTNKALAMDIVQPQHTTKQLSWISHVCPVWPDLRLSPVLSTGLSEIQGQSSSRGSKANDCSTDWAAGIAGSCTFVIVNGRGNSSVGVCDDDIEQKL